MIDTLLKPYQRFGVHLGLERSQELLGALGNPHLQVPIIHVAGSNGKGSVCAYLTSILKSANYKVGSYISPHLIDWNERISINQEPITNESLRKILEHINTINSILSKTPTQFEVITAASWLYFAENKVDIAVIEVGLGGRLDATNVHPQPLVSIINSISKEHCQYLGPTLADIAREKAGILKPGCPVVIGELPLEAKQVVEEIIQERKCPSVWIHPARFVAQGLAYYQGIEYPLPLLGDVQLGNSAVAIGAIQILQKQGWTIDTYDIQKGIGSTQWPGRLQWTTFEGNPVLIDGAHNPGAAYFLRQYVDTLDKPITWVIGILSTKDHLNMLQTLLKEGDVVYFVPVPDHSTSMPEELAQIAHAVCPQCLINTESDVFNALHKAYNPQRVTVLCGSLYLLGHFLQKCDSLKSGKSRN